MTELDDALEVLRQDTRNPEKQSRFYDLFLNSEFYIPTYITPENTDEKVEESGENRQGTPLVMEADGNDFLVLFSTLDRLNEWAKSEATYIQVPGHVIAENSTHPLHWVLNLGTEHVKIFVPDEIDWLKEAVALCKEEAGVGQKPSS
ncbi:SseB family protein [Geoalkalibacter subterraneus]|uniref:SseB protein N-terminal domain-containing protein n=1 Tax=Geoalkalibacter subterraneus TaxID=483547 RepID=A0A0B5FRE2_9BACT|nr:SseB family protein [Geoalkalibacter subterraneus]AJF06131.1 hypothetical protein GSUB_05510 [Geoalkalibacter subterraneus]